MAAAARMLIPRLVAAAAALRVCSMARRSALRVVLALFGAGRPSALWSLAVLVEEWPITRQLMARRPPVPGPRGLAPLKDGPRSPTGCTASGAKSQ